jgi:acetate---CoA ligase (ADP-forming)
VTASGADLGASEPAAPGGVGPRSAGCSATGTRRLAAAAKGQPDPAPLLHPRSVAVVGANDRPGSYGDVIFRNLAAAGFEGAVYGVNPKREEVHGKLCVPTVADLPEPVDAVVVAIPAAACAPVLIEAGERGCGGAIVLAAGFGETAAGRPLEDELREAARVTGIPVCGPNGNGVVSIAARAPLWGDSVERLSPGPVAVITQSGNFGVNALGSDRGLGFHTVVSTGNSVLLEPSDWLEALAMTDGVGSIALMLESDGDGARLARALATCAEREVGVAVLKVGSSERGAQAAGAHTGALAGDQRVFAALMEEAGAAQATDPGELLELARALAVPTARPRRADASVSAARDGSEGASWASSERPTGRSNRPAAAGAVRGSGDGGAAGPADGVTGDQPSGETPTASSTPQSGLAILTCSGGDSGMAADLAAACGMELPELSAAARKRLAEVLPSAATVGNPLDYTSMLWDEHEALEEVAAAVSSDPAIDQLLLLFDQPRGLDPEVAEGWEAVRRALLAGAAKGDAATILASTLPELLDPATARELTETGQVATAAGLSAAIACAAALRTPLAGPERLREIAAAAESGRDGGAVEGRTAGTEGAASGSAADDRESSGGGIDHATVDGTEASGSRGVPSGGPADDCGSSGGGNGAVDSIDGALGEAEAKRVLADGGLAVPDGGVAVDVAGAVSVALSVGLPVALKLSSPTLLHKTEAGALALDLRTEDEVRDAAVRLLSLPAAKGATLLVERMAGDGVELIFAVRRDGVVPALMVGVGGIWAEALDDVALVPLPASAERVERALRGLRAASLLTGGRGGPAVDLGAAARFGSRLGELALEHGLDLLEVNPALASPEGCVALDAVAIRPSA